LSLPTWETLWRQIQRIQKKNGGIFAAVKVTFLGGRNP
jgi:hypothetical protein